MAPELLTGRKCNSSVDIYSFGVRPGLAACISVSAGQAVSQQSANAAWTAHPCKPVDSYREGDRRA